jgi:hypothetical protein
MTTVGPYPIAHCASEETILIGLQSVAGNTEILKN